MRILGLGVASGKHGFLREIVVVVIGVLIALYAGNLAEAWNWQHKVAKGERQLVVESRENINYLAEQVAAGPCLQAQLLALRDRVLASGAILQPAPEFTERDSPTSSYVFRAPSRPYGDGIWRALNQDGTSMHMDDARQQRYSIVYGQIGLLNGQTDVSDLVTGRLTMLSHPLPLDASSRATLVGALEEQRARAALQTLIARQSLGAYRELGIMSPKAAVSSFLETSGTVAFCRKHALPLDDWYKVMRAQQ